MTSMRLEHLYVITKTLNQGGMSCTCTISGELNLKAFESSFWYLNYLKMLRVHSQLQRIVYCGKYVPNFFVQ